MIFDKLPGSALVDEARWGGKIHLLKTAHFVFRLICRLTGRGCVRLRIRLDPAMHEQPLLTPSKRTRP